MTFTYKGFIKDTDPLLQKGSRILSGANLNRYSKTPSPAQGSSMEAGKSSLGKVPPPPSRAAFATEEDYLEARDGYRHRIGKVLPRKKT